MSHFASSHATADPVLSTIRYKTIRALWPLSYVYVRVRLLELLTPAFTSVRELERT
jgi:hypothetical protein